MAKVRFTFFRIMGSLLLFSLLITLLNTLGIPNPFFNPFSHPASSPRPVTSPPGEFGADEKSTIQVFKNTSVSVVFIINSKLRQNELNLDIFDAPQGSGSGFIWDHEGHVVTNYHVVQGADSIDVTLHNQSTWKARVIGGDPNTDLAVLRIGASKDRLVPILIGSSNDLQAGQKVLAIGNPFGLDTTLTSGIISALGRSIPSTTKHAIHGMIQTDAAINPGNSGGPLLDSFGRLIGVNTAILSPSGHSSGIGFAIPVDTVNRVIPQLISQGSVVRAYLGVVMMPDFMAKKWGVAGTPILRVLPGTPAETAGLKGSYLDDDGQVHLGDIIMEINETVIKSQDQVLQILDTHQPKDNLSIKVQRENTTHSVEVTLGSL